MRSRLQQLLFCLLIMSTPNVFAMDIDARDAQAILSQTTMTLKRVHSGGSDYILHLRWNPATDSWDTESYETDYGYGWRPEADMPTGSYWAGSAVSGTKLFVIGGSSRYDKIGIYNSLTNTWADKSVSSMGYLLRAATVSGNIYIFDTSGNAKGWIYNIVAGTLTSMPVSFPNLKWTSDPAVYQGKIYFFGAYDGTSAPVRATWEFNPTTKIFTRKADMPTAGYAASTAVVNGKIYVIGGNYRRNQIEVYNPMTNSWVESHSFSQLSLSGWDAAGPLGGKVVIAATTGNTFLFDPSTRLLTLQESMSRVHSNYLTGEVVNGRLYVAGGQSTLSALDSFKLYPGPNVATATFSSQLEENSSAPEPDDTVIEAAHLRQFELLKQQ